MKTVDKIASGEVLVSLDKPFTDPRGMIVPLLNKDIKSCVLISSKQGSVRANHYHKTDWHYCYVLKGSIAYYHRPVGSQCSAEKITIREKQMFYTGPMIEHTMVFLEDTEFLTFGGNLRTQAEYEKDVVRISPLHLN